MNAALDPQRSVTTDYLSEEDLCNLGGDPSTVARDCPWAIELVALDGTRCWATQDLAMLLEEIR